ncbi:MAG: redoxin domain-containing protein [Chloroflexi bacterium]|nr:redoxin domain-containing protein [Chloroflexota bacterium]
MNRDFLLLGFPVRIALLLAAGLFLVGCIASTGMLNAPVSVDAPPEVVAYIDEQPVSVDQWEQAKAYAQVTMELLAEPGAVMDERSVFDAYIEDLLIVQEAAEEGFTVSDEEVEAEERRILTVAGVDERALEEALARVGLSREAWREELARGVLAANYIEKVALADVAPAERGQRRADWLNDLRDKHQIILALEHPVTVGLREGNLVPDFTLATLDGGEKSLSDLRGQAVILNFWATWCFPCREEMPLLEKKYQANKDKGLVVVGVNVGESPAQVQEFVDNIGVTFPIWLDRDQKVSRQYRVFGLPSTFFINREGVIESFFLGQLRNAQLKEFLPRILAEPD